MFRTDGHSSLSKIPALRLNLLFEDKEDEIKENQFTECESTSKHDRHMDFGGYFPADQFISNTKQCLLELLQHAWSKLNDSKTIDNHSLLTGDDLSSHCYCDHAALKWDAGFRFT